MSGIGGGSDVGGVKENVGLGLNYVIVGSAAVCLVIVAVVLAAAMRCYSTWKSWAHYERQKDEEDSTKATIRISHSLPDLTHDISKHEYIQEVKDKKVTVPLA